MPVDLSKITYVERLIVGNDNPEHLLSQKDLDAQVAKLNAALQGFPKAKIIGIEKNFALFAINEHQIALEWLCYHLGYERKPQ